MKQILNRLKWLKVLFTPFIFPRVKFYIGKIAYGTPYFYPRKWVNVTEKEAKADAHEKFSRLVDLGKKPKTSLWIEFYKSALKRKKPVPKKFGYDLVGLGYKTKWSDTDYRFEWNPIFSFVFFKYQFCIFPIVPEHNHYWEAWLYYENHTDKNLSKKERIEKCKEEFPMIYTVSRGYGQTKETVNYYDKVLKKKYR
jgi:hypothetical protein